jgi:hypothetical protein
MILSSRFRGVIHRHNWPNILFNLGVNPQGSSSKSHTTVDTTLSATPLACNLAHISLARLCPFYPKQSLWVLSCGTFVELLTGLENQQHETAHLSLMHQLLDQYLYLVFWNLSMLKTAINIQLEHRPI